MGMLISRSPQETERFGVEWGSVAGPDWTIALIGDLGAGKTQLVKGLARGLGSGDRISSPTFTLVHVYEGGRLPLYHLDLYRLETPEAIERAGLGEYLDAEGVKVIEWADRWPLGWSGNVRWVKIERIGEEERRITYEDSSD